jgi:phenylacetate-CoA ligase
MGLYTTFMRNLTLPVYDLMRGTSRFQFGRVLDKTQWLPREDIERLQNRNLRFLIRHSYDTVPYYNRVFRKIGLSPEAVRCVEDLSKVPVLTKEDVRANSSDLVSRGFPMGQLVPYTSGGSGDQLRFYVTKDQLSWEIAAEFRAYGWADYKLGDNCFMFWASPIDLSKYKSVQKRFSSKLERVFIGNTYILSNQVLSKFAALLLARRPKIVKGYTSSIYLMAKYLVDNGIDGVRPKAVITTAETLFDSMRETIETAFGCKVFDFYGSREVGGLAAECEAHSGYHLSAENVAMEFVKDGEQVGNNEKGVILVTSLRNYGMPFIRYKLGDVGSPSGRVCECGRGLPLVNTIEGRISDFMAVYDKSGNVVPVGPIYPLIIYGLMKVPLKSVRVLQKEVNKLEIKAVKSKGYSQKHTDYLIKQIHDGIGEDVQIEFEFLDSLPPLPSGKRSTFISKINAFQQ